MPAILSQVGDQVRLEGLVKNKGTNGALETESLRKPFNVLFSRLFPGSKLKIDERRLFRELIYDPHMDFRSPGPFEFSRLGVLQAYGAESHRWKVTLHDGQVGQAALND